MRTLCVSFCLILAAEIPTIAADDNGPRLDDHQTIARPAPPHRNPANIRVDVNMALVPVTVLDAYGRNVLGLKQENFRVFDGTEQRPIVSFGLADAPVSIGLVYDSSGSMGDKFKIAREAPLQLFPQLNPEDEAFLITVSSRPELRQDFTSRFQEITNALLFVSPRGQTSLVDGIYMGLQRLKKAHNSRKALIVVSDGGDNNSRYNMRELANLAAEADAQIFTICLYGHPQSPEELNGPALLDRLARISGGIRYMIGDVNNMKTAFTQIGITLHNEYLLGIYPADDAPSGKYRKLKVQLLVPENLPRLQIYARSGYYVP
jgi:Ca-activated chloride channel family protein